MPPEAQPCSLDLPSSLRLEDEVEALVELSRRLARGTHMCLGHRQQCQRRLGKVEKVAEGDGTGMNPDGFDTVTIDGGLHWIASFEGGI